MNGESVSIRAGGQTFTGLAWGQEGSPVVLAFHGWTDNAATFTRLAPLLEGMRLIALDLAGHGHSDHRPEGGDYPLWSFIPDIVAIGNALGLSKLHLLGHSMGGIVSTMMAATVPERVASIALIDGLLPGTVEEKDFLAQMKKGINWRIRGSRAGRRTFASIEEAVEARLNGFSKLSPQAAEILVSRGLKEQNGGWVWRTDSRLMAPTVQRLTPTQAECLLAAVEAPACLVVAEDGFIHGQVKALKGKVDHFDPVVITGGHHLHLEDEALQVAERLQPHFDKVLGAGC